MKNYTAIIVDDNEDNSHLLQIYLKKHCPYIEVLLVVRNVKEAILAYDSLHPQILFLDIQLENDTIFSFLDAVPELEAKIIMISSHSQFAVKAIKHEIVDYLLKPFEINDLIRAVNKAVVSISKEEELNFKKEYKEKLKYIAVSDLEKVHLIDVEDIIYFEADGRYTDFHLTNKKKITSSRNIGKYEELLVGNNEFFRTHHKYVVNFNFVKNINKVGGFYCELVSKISLPVSKRKYEKLLHYLKLR